MYLKKIPSFLTKTLGDVTWHGPRDSGKVFLSFDDGPDPSSTPLLLELLKKWEVKASFFCLGEKAAEQPHLIAAIREAGHQIGAHGMKHLDGWKTDDADYLANAIESMSQLQTKLFRPPYGRISLSQFRALKDECEIVLWDVMPGDFDESVSAQECSQHIIKHTRQGSLIVLHDRADLREKLHQTLSEVIPLLKSRFELNSYNFSD